MPPYENPLNQQQKNLLLDLTPYLLCRNRRDLTKTIRLELFPDVLAILDWCIVNDLKISICSRSPDKNVIQKILKCFKLWKIFTAPQIFDAPKTTHFSILNSTLGAQFQSFLFYDDIQSNINAANSLGVTSCLVDREKGITWAIFIRGLAKFYAISNSRISLTRWLTSPSQLAVSEAVASDTSAKHSLLRVEG